MAVGNTAVLVSSKWKREKVEDKNELKVSFDLKTSDKTMPDITWSDILKYD